jgi:hypothetical protein
MAVGDIINSVETGAFSFQPAVSVEIMLTSVSTSPNDELAYLTDGVNDKYFMKFNIGVPDGYTNMKVGITNTYYLKVAVPGGTYSGIQIK